MKFTKRLNKTGLAMTIASAGLLASSNSMASDPSHLEHNHGAGTFMVATEFMNMRMDGNISGTKNPGKLKGMKAQGGQGYMVEPTQMDMQMFMLMPMYNVTSDFSVMLMANYISNSMEMDTTATGTQSMSTSGIGDTQLSFDYKMFDQSLAVGLGVNIPTGSITEETEMTMMMDHDMGGGMVHTMAMEHSMRAPYSMQLGSGTYDFKPSLTYLGAFFTWRYGAQVSYTYRSGENSEGYTLGDSADAMLWVRKAVGPVNLSAETAFKRSGDIEGFDPAIHTAGEGSMAMMKTNPLAQTSSYGGTFADLDIGASTPIGFANLGVAATIPLYQDANGTAMKRTVSFTGSISAMF